MNESWTLLRLNPVLQPRYCDLVREKYPEVSTYYPTYERLTRPARKRHPILMLFPVYPGYVFARLDLSYARQLTILPIRASFIRFEHKIATVQDSVIDHMKHLESGGKLIVKTMKDPYTPGRPIFIHTPAFDIQAIILRMVRHDSILADTPLGHMVVKKHHVELLEA